MKSSIKISRGGRSITFRGGAARAAFESLTGVKLPPKEEPKQLKPCEQSTPVVDEERERSVADLGTLHLPEGLNAGSDPQ